MYRLGLLADLGEGEAPDARTAYAFYRRAAEAGNPAAEFNVATMQDNGRGTARDETGAAVSYARAASHGNRRAEYDLGLLYGSGEGVPANPAMARAWFAQAAQAGLPAARGKLGAPQSRPRFDRLHADPQLLPAVPVWPDPQPALSTRSVELVWNAPAEPVAVHFFLQVEEAPSGKEILARYVEVSAFLLDLPAGTRAGRWRVFTVSPRTASYTASNWRAFATRAGS